MKKTAAILALCAALALSGCSPAPAAGPDYAPPESERLTVYTSHKEEVYWPIVKEFEERTGVWVDVVEGGTNEILDRIGQGASPAADVMFGGGVESLLSHAGCFTPYVCSESAAIDPQFTSPDGLWTPFSSLPVVLVYNTKLLSPGAVSGWADLLSPELKGKIAFADPAVSGSSFTALATMAAALGGDWEETVSAFAANLDGRQLSGSGEVLTAVADGTAWVGVTLEETALKRIADGEDLALIYPAEGTSSVPDAGALVKGAPHEDNAKLFLDFIAGADVQALLADQFCRRSVRTDTPPADLPALSEIELVDYDVPQASRRHDAVLMTWAFYLGGEGETP